MIDNTQNEFQPDYVTPPGETLLETIEAIGMSQAALAERTGRSKKTINEIIKGKAPITPKISLEFERVLGVPAGFWNSYESMYREALAREEEREKLASDVEWLKRFPISEMVRREWVQGSKDKVELLQRILEFFGIASPEQWPKLVESYLSHSVAFRKSEAFTSDPAALVAWLRKGESEADGIECAPYNRDKLMHCLTELRSLTRELPEIFQPAVREICSACGVAVVFTPELPKTRVSGATRWLNPNKAIIQLSLRYKTDDHLWFSFFHEVVHIVRHGKRELFLESVVAGVPDKREDEANRIAADILIAPKKLKGFVKMNDFGKKAITRFASEIGIAPGIVVGRLQHDRLLPYTHCNDLKRRFEWSEE
jgi:HTH-type transcriptional regulator / antitoxin HigA